ncbi:MAG: leucine-rich repeat domain-containing protein [Firmicutes bacterium]|nr:leucine-rich repeat domain-containing protein [Bacillota bacterium]
MIYDSKETFMEIENLIEIAEDGVILYRVDYDGLEEGRRYLQIPDGIKVICANAFSEYNCSELAVSVSRNLVMPEQNISDWAKRLTVKSGVKFEFPAEVGKSTRKRAEYMAEKERRVRFLRINLPESIEKVSKDSFPVLLEEINVAENNGTFTSSEGVLFSKDMKTLVRYPGYKNIECYEVPDGVETIAEGAFQAAFVRNLILPESVKNIEKGSFENAVIECIEIKDGISEIEQETFVNCDIKEMILPATLKKIGDYAFRGTSGIRKLLCASDELEIGNGIFSGGNFNDVKWWPWEVIPKAAFLNGKIRLLHVPEGVITIEDYAFAGCYKAEEIVIPESVKEVGKWSFDEGATFSADVTLPESLYKYVYRFPALSRINKQAKSEVWKKADTEGFTEESDVLQKQKEYMEKYIKTLNFLQTTRKRQFEKEIKTIEEILDER